MTVYCPHKLCFLHMVMFLGYVWSCWNYERHYCSTHMEKCYKTSYLTWVALYGESLLLSCCVWWSEWCSVTCVSSIFISLICVVCKWSFSPLCKLFQVYYVTCVETSLPYSDVLKYSMLSDILVLLSIPPSIAPYFRLMWICFHLNLEVVVVDYYDSTHHSIFLGNPFLKLEGTCPTQPV